MDLAALVQLAITASICLIVVSLGLGATHEDALYLFRRPGELLRALISMNVVMPLVAAALAAPFGLSPAMQITLVALAVSPVPPILPRREVNVGGRASYAIGLLTAAGLLAVVYVPIAMSLLGRLFSVDVHMPTGIVARIVAITVLGPLATGIIVRRVAPDLAARIARPLALAGFVLLGLGVVMVLLSAWRAAWALVGSGRVLALVAFVVIGLAVGQLLGGPRREDRTVLALSTALRHPGMALAIGGTLFPEHHKFVTGGLVLYLLVGQLLLIPYLIWRRRQIATVASSTGGP